MVFPTYMNPQGQDKEETKLDAKKLIGFGIEIWVVDSCSQGGFLAELA